MNQRLAKLECSVNSGKASILQIVAPVDACESGILLENRTRPVLSVFLRDADGNTTYALKGSEIFTSVSALGTGTLIQSTTTELQNQEVSTPICINFDPIEVHEYPVDGVAVLLCSLQLRPIANFRGPGYNVPAKPLDPLTLKLRVRPSSAPSRILLYEDDVELDSQAPIVCEAGSKLNLTFVLLDESQVPVQITTEHTSKLKLSWSPRSDARSLLQGILAPIDVPTSTSVETELVIYYGEVFSHSFKVRARAGRATHMSVEMLDYRMTVGQAAPMLYVKFTDQLNNVVEEVDEFLPQFNIETDDKLIDVSKLVKKRVTLPKSKCPGVALSGYQFEEKKCCTKVVKITHLRFPPVSASIKLTSGQLHHFKIDTPLFEGQARLIVLNGSNFPELSFKLFDEYDNLASVLPSKELYFDLITPPTFKLGNKNDNRVRIRPHGGQATWPTPELPVAVRGNCGETYTLKVVCCNVSTELKVKVVAGNLPKELVPDIETYQMVVGRHLPRCILKVEAENGSFIPPEKLDRSAVLLKMWRAPEGFDEQPPPPISPVWQPIACENEHFVFGGVNEDRIGPTEAGAYYIAFFYNDLESSRIEVLPDRPQKLFSSVEALVPQTLMANSNPQDLIAVKSFILELKDRFGNCVGARFNGEVLLEILPGTNSRDQDTPRLSNFARTFQLQLTDGRCEVPDILLDAGSMSSRQCRRRYLVRFTLVSLASMSAEELTQVEHFEVPFMLVDEHAKQEHLHRLNSEHARLKNQLAQLTSDYSTIGKQRVRLQRTLLLSAPKNVQTAETDSRRIFDALRNKCSTMREAMHIEEPEEEPLRKLAYQLENDIRSASRSTRGGQLPPRPNEAGVIGYVGELGFVEDDNLSRLITWIIGSNELATLIVEDKAKELELLNRNPQQVYWCCEHIQKRAWPVVQLQGHAAGNPRLALDSVTFPEGAYNEIAKRVFVDLLGNTLIMDNKQVAMEYRSKALAIYGNCPTIICLADSTQINRRGQTGGPGSRLACPNNFNYILQKPNTLLPRLREALDLVNKQINCIKALKKANEELAGFNQVNRPEKDHLSDINSTTIRIKEIEREIQELNTDDGGEGVPNPAAASGQMNDLLVQHESSARAFEPQTVPVDTPSSALLHDAGQSPAMSHMNAAPGVAHVSGWQSQSPFAAFAPPPAAAAAAANVEDRPAPQAGGFTAARPRADIDQINGFSQQAALFPARGTPTSASVSRDPRLSSSFYDSRRPY